ncbi:MAG: hypothetical protein KGQ70_00950 [Alphaproteobacteria bacterium]|nr:hypothetical protein [Alphaproteobacteria bacterium]
MMAVGQFFKNMITSFYRGGEQFTESVSRGMDPVKARRIGRAVDAIGGGVLTYMGAAGLVGNALGIAALVSAAGLVSAPVVVTTLATTAVFGTLNVLGTAFGLGLLSAAAQKTGLPAPHAVAQRVAHETARPFKWTARKLRHPFRKAHDGQKAPKKQPKMKRTGPKPGSYKL